MNAGDWPVRIEVPVAWGEQDLFGHVNNVVYFRYFESVRMYFLERTGILASHASIGHGVILASTTCDFLRPVVWPTKLTVHTRCESVGSTSFTMGYLITDEQDNEVARGTSVQVMYDYRAGHKIPVPQEIRNAIANL